MENSVLRRILFAVAIASLLATPVASIAAATPVAAQVTPLDDEPDDAPGLGSIVGSPDAGPKPEDPGDRGGYAQLGVALIMLGGISFIGWRIVRGVRQNNMNVPERDPL